jgi:hypothetical protein
MAKYLMFVCALSLAVDAHIALATTDDDKTACCVQHAALQAVSTVDSLVSMVPQDYQHVLHKALTGIAATATKLFSARTTIAWWLQHQAAGTVLLHMKSAMPEVQLMWDFAGDVQGAAHAAVMWDAYQKYQEAILANAICAKQDDIHFLEASLTPKHVHASMLLLITQRCNEILAKTRSWRRISRESWFYLGGPRIQLASDLHCRLLKTLSSMPSPLSLSWRLEKRLCQSRACHNH